MVTTDCGTLFVSDEMRRVPSPPSKEGSTLATEAAAPKRNRRRRRRSGFWPCSCDPYVAEFHPSRWNAHLYPCRTLLLVHHVSCDEPVERRVTMTGRLTGERAA
jgi:hypothetical protein